MGPTGNIASGIELGGNTITQDAGGKLVMRNIHAANTLSAGPDCAVTVDGSSVIVSSMPLPGAFSYVQMAATNGVDSADPYYWASGATTARTEVDIIKIAWDDTNNYFTVADDGFYEVHCVGSVIVTTGVTTVQVDIIKTTGLGGTETVLNLQSQTIATSIDPHMIGSHWMGYLEAGDKVTCRIDGSSATSQVRGSSISCRRIH